MSDCGNHLIARLPKGVQKRFLERCEPFGLVLSAELGARSALLSHAYFPVTGFISLVIDIESHPPLEAGMVGRESMLGSELVLGVASTPWRAVVQGPGHCWRIPAPALRQALQDMPALTEVLQRALLVRLHQQTLASACERFHSIGQRLARWLLMSQDRAQDDHFQVTQAFISLMLGVRRVGVTQAAGHFQRRGLIQYKRGVLQVLDRAGLEREACSCYGADRKLLTDLLPAKR